MDIAMNNHRQFPQEQTLSLAVNVEHLPSGSDEPAKRRPGRPKGSVKKTLLGTPSPSKAKRPVGRPRKDGLPAGSVGSVKPKRERSFYVPSQADGSFQGVPYPHAMAIYHPPVPQFVPAPVLHIDPSLVGDEWADLARNDAHLFLSTLLAALAAPNPISSGGPTVEEAFRAHLHSLTSNPQHPHPIPSLYSVLKSFWLPSSPAYFSLTASAASTARTPSEHRFLYWDPLPLVFNGIGCPHCGTPLLNRCKISSGPVKIYDIEKPFFIIGCEYVCKGPQCVSPATPEGRKFASTDSSILRALPVKLKDEFPAKLLYGNADAGSGPNIWNWKALGVSWSLWNMVHGALGSGLKKEVILHLIHSIQRGVPPFDEPGREMEEEEVIPMEHTHQQEQDDSESHSQLQQQQAQPEQPNLHSHDLQNGDSSIFSDAYNNAWKEDTAVTDNSIKSPGPSNVQAESTSSTGQAFQYHPYPFSPYAYMSPHTIANGQMVSLTSPPPLPPSHVPTSMSAHHHTAGSSEVELGHAPLQESHSKRSPRHCCKCGSHECKGKGGRTFCSNRCQDCGNLDCKGRNSRRPDKKCSEGWS